MAAFGDLDCDGDIDFVHTFNLFSGLGPINANNVWLNNGDNTFVLYNSVGTSQTDPVLSLTENDGLNLKLYPNPAKDYLAIVSETNSAISEFEIYDMNGKYLNLKKNMLSGNVNVSNLSN
ncbi:MAG: hypothetical protein Aureis2KO_25890 [Aureisphaera sp.]